MFIGKIIVTLQPFIISLDELASGRSEFHYRVGEEFFGAFGNTEISAADVSVIVIVNKVGSCIGVDCDIDGFVTLPCDRCLEPLELPVRAAARLKVELGKESDTVWQDGDRELMYLSDADVDLDLSQTVYDYCLLSLPMQKVHKDGECNPIALGYLCEDEAEDVTEDRMNSPFAALKTLIDNK